MYRTDMYEGMLAETVTVTGHNGTRSARTSRARWARGRSPAWC